MKKNLGIREVAGAVFGFLLLLSVQLSVGSVGSKGDCLGDCLGDCAGKGAVGGGRWVEMGRRAELSVDVLGCGGDGYAENSGCTGARLRRAPPGRLWIGRYEAWCKAGPQRGAEGGRVMRAAMSLAGELQWARVLGRGSPPSLEQAAGYFKEALGEEMIVDGPQRYRFERRTGLSWGTSWRRALLVGMEQGLSLEWWASDDFGVSELREFFEAPFFELSETLLLHTWLSEGGWHEAFFQGYSLRMGVLCRDEYVYVWMRWLDTPPFAG